MGGIYPEKRGFAGPDKSLTATCRDHHGNHPVYSGNDEETFQTDTASPAWREPNRVPDAKLRDGVPITPFHGQLWWFPVGTIRGLCGFASYLLTAWIILEPVWSQRIYNAVIGLLILSLFMVQGVPGSYIYMLPFLFGTLILLALYPKISIRHFKEGMQ